MKLSWAKRKKRSLSLRRKPISEKPVIVQGCEPPTKRFVETCDDEVHLSKKKPRTKNTEISQLWGFNVFKEWLKFHASGESEEPVVEYVEADLFSEDAEKVCAIMCVCSRGKTTEWQPSYPQVFLRADVCACCFFY